MIKKTALLLALLVQSASLIASDFIVINNPADSSTVSGSPLIIDGNSSQASCTVRLTIDTTIIGETTTDLSGDWNFSYPFLGDGAYTVTADLISGSFELLATDTNSFTIGTSESIFIASPFEEEDIVLSSTIAYGFSSLASTTVELYIDNVLESSGTTAGDGSWQLPFTLPTNGSHDIRVDLVVAGNPVASSGVTVIGKVPVLLPSEKAQLTIITGTIPTFGSGTGDGFSYSISGSTATITFDNAFSTTPIILATGQDSSSADAIVTVVTVSTTSVDILFTSTANALHFIALTSV